jgi:hypothetical protein
VPTESEAAFEDFCTSRCLAFSKVTEGRSPVPDYQINVLGVEIVAEVKEFKRSAEEEAVLDEIEAGKREGYVRSVTPGNAVRRKTKKAAKQIRALTKGAISSMLVLFNKRTLSKPVDAYQIRVGMYGFDAIVLAVPQNLGESPYTVDRRFSGSRQVTENTNTSLGGVSVLNQGSNKLELTVFHNIYAATPLPIEQFRRLDIRQFTLDERQHGQFQDWVEL